MTLKELRQQSGKTAAEVATALGVAVSTLYNYEQGIREIGIEQVLILANLFDTAECDVIKAQLQSIKNRTNL